MLAEGHPLLEHLLARFLQVDGGLEIVVTTRSLDTAIESCVKHKPELLIVDIPLAYSEVCSLAFTLKQFTSETKFIWVSCSTHAGKWPSEVSAQLLGIIDQNSSYEDLLALVKPLLPSKQSQNAVDISGLTPREEEILVTIGRGLKSSEIADELGIAVRTVETHRRNIISKLGVSGVALVRKATLAALTAR